MITKDSLQQKYSISRKGGNLTHPALKHTPAYVPYTCAILSFVNSIGELSRGKSSDYVNNLWFNCVLQVPPKWIVPSYLYSFVQLSMEQITSFGDIDVSLYRSQLNSLVEMKIYDPSPENQLGTLRGLYDKALISFLKNLNNSPVLTAFDDVSVIPRLIPHLLHFHMSRQSDHAVLQEIIIKNTLITTNNSASCILSYVFSVIYLEILSAPEIFRKRSLIDVFQLTADSASKFEAILPKDLFEATKEVSAIIVKLTKYLIDSKFSDEVEVVSKVHEHLVEIAKPSLNLKSILGVVVAISVVHEWYDVNFLSMMRSVQCYFLGDASLNLMLSAAVMTPFLTDQSYKIQSHFSTPMMNLLTNAKKTYNCVGVFTEAITSKKYTDEHLGTTLNLEIETYGMMIQGDSLSLVKDTGFTGLFSTMNKELVTLFDASTQSTLELLWQDFCGLHAMLLPIFGESEFRKVFLKLSQSYFEKYPKMLEGIKSRDFGGKKLINFEFV